MKYTKSTAFSRDWGSMSETHKALALAAVPAFHGACIERVEDPGKPWPKGLRVHGVKGHSGVIEVTLNFEQPDIRATFEWTEIHDELAVRWRRIGDHGIFKDP